MEQTKQTDWKSALSAERIGLAVFFAFSLALLGGYNYEFLYKVQNCNLFLANKIFFNEMLQHSAGLFRYASRYLTQFLYYPWLGALFLSLGLLAIKKLTDLLTGTDGKWTALNYLPSFLCLLAQTTVGYTLYCNFESAFIIELELGLIVSLLLANAIK